MKPNPVAMSLRAAVAANNSIEWLHAIRAADEIDRLESENAHLRALLGAARYSYSEIEAACGGELAASVRAVVLKRRAAIDAARKATDTKLSAG